VVAHIQQQIGTEDDAVIGGGAVIDAFLVDAVEDVVRTKRVVAQLIPGVVPEIHVAVVGVVPVLVHAPGVAAELVVLLFALHIVVAVGVGPVARVVRRRQKVEQRRGDRR